MNERIFELGKQATIWCCDHSPADWDAAWEEKFAELIVKECIDIAYREGDNVAYLALHFGVEE